MSKQKDRFIDFGLNAEQVNSADIPCIFSPLNYSPADNTIEEHLKAIDAHIATTLSIEVDGGSPTSVFSGIFFNGGAP
jgi:hypothetical protein